MDELDFAFAFEGASGPAGPWQHLRVVEFRGTEGMSTLYRYEISTLVREPAPEVDPDDLVGARATLRIATGVEPPFRVVHGLIIEAEEIGWVQGASAYRVVLAPPFTRAMHRTRCRVFLEKSLRQIIDAVFQDDPDVRRADGTVAEPDDGLMSSFTPAQAVYAWRVADAARIDQPTVRPYCVQYNESDLAFVARLLEEEGISYHFENGSGKCILVFSDRDGGRTRLEPFTPLNADLKGREVSGMKLGARLRPKKVSLLDYDWRKPALDMAVEQAGQGGGDLVEHEYPGRYSDGPDQGKPLAAAKLDRLEVEASYAVGEGPCRLLSAGTVFALEHTRARYTGEYLVTKMEVRGEQYGELAPDVITRAGATGLPYRCTFECARRGKEGGVAESRFRPARLTPKPRIVGSQTAFVTAEPSTQGEEIHVGGPPGGEIGCVRVRFHWDKESDRHGKEPTSGWVRVSQVFAGVGEGAVWHPRVGVEVIVDFEDGDPDRPLIVGRVYNGQNRPPVTTKTVSTLTSMTSPGDGTYNEFTFDDTAGSQQIRLHTPRDWNSEVGNDRSEVIVVNSTSNVGVDRSEATGVNRMTMVGVNNAEVVGENEAVTVGVDQQIAVGANQTVLVGADQSVSVVKNQSVAVGENQVVVVTGSQEVHVQGNRGVTVQGNAAELVTGMRVRSVRGDEQCAVTGKQQIVITGQQETALLAEHVHSVKSHEWITVGGNQLTTVIETEQHRAKQQLFFAASQQLSVEGSQLLESATFDVEAVEAAAINTKQLLLNGATQVSVSGGKLVIAIKGDIEIEAANITFKATKISYESQRLAFNGEDEVEIRGALIKLN